MNANINSKYFFFVNDEKFETDQEYVTGAYIKSRVASLPPGSGLELEGQGNEPNKSISDGDTVSLKLGHGQGAMHFTTSPPANFG
jgi:hypothetical protein